MNTALALIAALVLGPPAPAAPPPAPPPAPTRAAAPPAAPVAAAAVWPLEPTAVAHGFDPPAPDEPVWAPGHRGVDLVGAPGQPVRAALAGTVTFAGVLAGRGVVVVSHGARRTTYEPVLAGLAVGARVQAGTRIGVLAPGGHCAPAVCLHWGLIAQDTYLDPLSLFGPRPVRLLPVL